MMQFSVIIPCHNAAPYIGAALKSVAEQTYPPHEIIVIDDASTDESVQRVRETGVGVRLLQVNHRNGAAARNEGIDVATGDWIAFQDADDIWYPMHLERAAALLERTGAIGYLSHADRFRDGSSEYLRSPPAFPLEEPSGPLSPDEFVRHFARSQSFTMPSCVLERRALVERGKLDPAQYRRHDIDMWLRVIAGHSWCYDPVATVAYRVDTPGSISRNVADREYWFLNAMLRNRERYDESAMDSLMAVAARRAMSSAFTDGDAEARRKARALAFAYLTRKDRAYFRLASLCPPAFAALNRYRRRLAGFR